LHEKERANEQPEQGNATTNDGSYYQSSPRLTKHGANYSARCCYYGEVEHCLSRQATQLECDQLIKFALGAGINSRQSQDYGQPQDGSEKIAQGERES
jgi:hypothetical protein